MARRSDIGIRVFPNRDSSALLKDSSLIHYQGKAPVYGDRIQAGGNPYPDFYGVFGRNEQLETSSRSYNKSNSKAAVSFQTVDHEMKQEKLERIKEKFESSDVGQSMINARSNQPVIPRPPATSFRAETPPNSPTIKSRTTSYSSTSSYASAEKKDIEVVTKEFAFLSENPPQKVSPTFRGFSGEDKWAGEELILEAMKTTEEIKQQRHSMPVFGVRTTKTTTTVVRTSSTSVSPTTTKKPPPPYINKQLLAELKQLDGTNGMNSIQKSMERLKAVQRKEIEEKEEETDLEIARVKKEWTVEKFLKETPEISDKTGLPLPDWQRHMMAKKKQEFALQEEIQRLQYELEEWKEKRNPNWRRRVSTKM